MNGKRLKMLAIVLTLAVSGGALLTWTQPWFAIALTQGTHAGSTIDVPGESAGTAVAALGLAGLALGGALGIAGRILRVIFGVLEILIGASVVLSGILALADPAGASAKTVTEVTGVAGAEGTNALIASATATIWPGVAVALGVILALLGLMVIITGTSWPTSGRKFDSPVQSRQDQAHDAVDSWDELSRGEDPTS